jgi:hypothetical protein
VAGHPESAVRFQSLPGEWVIASELRKRWLRRANGQPVGGAPTSDLVLDPQVAGAGNGRENNVTMTADLS